MFDAKKEKNNICQWIRDYFEQNASPATKAVIGISGGIDSTVCAALCVESLGKDRVLGIHMPNGRQDDFNEAQTISRYLGIETSIFNIETIMKELNSTFSWRNCISDINDVVKFNTPARVRMTILYMFAGQFGGRVVNTCNLSESFIGYDTKWGDNVGDFAPIADFTKSEVRLIAKELDLEDWMITKTPIDGLCGLSDEERYGFSYERLDEFIRFGFIDNDDKETVEIKILNMNALAKHKLNPIPRYHSSIPHYPI